MLETIAGIKLTHIGAGLAGGSVRYILLGGTWRQAFASVFSGCLAAAYGTPFAYFALTHYMPSWKDPSTELVMGFLVGLCALILCEGVMNYVKARRDKYLQADIPPLRPSPPLPPVPPPAPQAGG